MSANIKSMAYYGEKPWHGLGTEVAAAMTADEAITAAGLDWTVSKEPIFLADGTEVLGQFAIKPSNGSAPFGVVGSYYHPLQNREAFSFADAVVGEKGAHYHTAGALGEGELVWMLLKVPGMVRTAGDDVTEKFMLLSHRHDGRGSVQVALTGIRVVCQNTLNAAIGSAKAIARLRHTATLGLRVGEVRETLGLVNSAFAEFEEKSKALAAVKLDGKGLEAYLTDVLLAGKATAQGKASARSANVIKEVTGLFENGMGADIPEIRGSAWAAYNAVTEYVDHHRTTRKEETADEHAQGLLFGTGAKLKAKAFEVAEALIA